MDKSELKFKDLTEKNLEWARQLHNDPEVLNVLTDPHKVAEQEQIKWFKKLKKLKTSKRLVAFYGKIPIGIIRLDEIDKWNKSIRVGLDIHKDFRGKGYGTLAYRKLLAYCFDELNMHRVYLMVASHNPKAKNLYKKVGFKEEGIMREALLRNGEYSSYIMMSILEDEYAQYHKS